jgi:hypothetical protein
MKPLGKNTLKGKEKEVVAYEVVGQAQESVSMPPATHPEVS